MEVFSVKVALLYYYTNQSPNQREANVVFLKVLKFRICIQVNIQTILLNVVKPKLRCWVIARAIEIETYSYQITSYENLGEGIPY